MLTNFETIRRLLLSTLLGGLIGIEREYNNRPAGFRTHVLVTVGSTLIMIISVDGVSKLGLESMGDPYRIAAQVVSGIGFLGAGTIMKTGNSIEGLTTAASLWICAGIGLSIGTGHFLGAIVTEVIVILTLMSGYIDNKAITRRPLKSIEIMGINRETLIRQLGEIFDNNNIIIKDMYVEEDNVGLEEKFIKISFKVKIPKDFNLSFFVDDIYSLEGIRGIVFEKANIDRRA